MKKGNGKRGKRQFKRKGGKLRKGVENQGWEMRLKERRDKTK